MTAPVPFAAPLPEGEALRQAALHASGVLMMRGNQKLRAIVDRVAELFDTPLAAVSIIDRDRQWFPAFHGADVEETARDVAFCAHTILTPGQTTIVPNAAEDPRFAENPMVTGDPFVRFYIGAPLVTRDGAALGALCAVDSKPHAPPVPSQHEEELRALADQVMAEIERIENIRNASPDAIVAIVDQIRNAAESDDEELMLSLDRILRRVEHIAQDM